MGFQGKWNGKRHTGTGLNEGFHYAFSSRELLRDSKPCSNYCKVIVHTKMLKFLSDLYHGNERTYGWDLCSMSDYIIEAAYVIWHYGLLLLIGYIDIDWLKLNAGGCYILQAMSAKHSRIRCSPNIPSASGITFFPC
jgi:hypothetical protein